MVELMDESFLKSVQSDLPFYWFFPPTNVFERQRSVCVCAGIYVKSLKTEKKGWESMSNYYWRCWYWHHKINFSFAQKLHFILRSYLSFRSELTGHTKLCAFNCTFTCVTESRWWAGTWTAFFARNDVWVWVPKTAKKWRDIDSHVTKREHHHKCIDFVC